MKIGMIGLGIMGKPMAKNLLKAGYDLTVSDLNRASVDELAAFGAKSAGNTTKLANQIIVVCTI